MLLDNARCLARICTHSGPFDSIALMILPWKVYRMFAVCARSWPTLDLREQKACQSKHSLTKSLRCGIGMSLSLFLLSLLV
jgi:hypothetical protein